MSFGGSTPKFLADTKEVIDLAEALGSMLVAKVSNNVREAIALEASIWRTDMLRILNKLGKDMQCHFKESDRSHFGGALADETDRAVPMSQTSSLSSCVSLPITKFHRATTLEHQLAADIFASTYSECSSAKDSRVKTRKKRRATTLPKPQTHSCQDRPDLQTFEPLVPTQAACIDRVPGQLIVDDCDATVSSGEHESMRRIRGQSVVFTSSSPSTHWNKFSNTNCLNSSGSHLNAIESEDDRNTQTPELDSAKVGGPMVAFGRAPSSTESKKTAKRWKAEARKFYENRYPVSHEDQRMARSLFSNVFRALGFVPWSEERLWLSWLYRFAFVCCLVGSTISVIVNSCSSHSIEKDHIVFAAYIDDILAVATILSFSAAIWKNKALQDSVWLIEAYLSRACLLAEAREKTCRDMAMSLFVWSVSVALRFYFNASAMNVSNFGFAFNTLVLLAICFYVSRLCHCLFCMVDDFCRDMQDNSDFEVALQEFFLLHCTIRTTCTSLQLCFVVLQLTATVIFLFCSASIYLGRITSEWVLVPLIPGVLCQGALLQILIRAGQVSDLCARVPMLVNAVNAKVEVQRMYLVDYIVHCQAGFHIFEVRLSTATLLKLFYVAFVAWCSLLTQGMLG